LPGPPTVRWYFRSHYAKRALNYFCKYPGLFPRSYSYCGCASEQRLAYSFEKVKVPDEGTCMTIAGLSS